MQSALGHLTSRSTTERFARRRWSSTIVNLKQLRAINTSFYRCLLRIREFVRAYHAHLVLCELSPEHREIFELFQAFRLFTVVRTEGEAVRVARA